MSGGIDTRVEGSAASIQGTADWLRGSLGTAVSDTATGTAYAISSSGWDWLGDAGDGFRDDLSDSLDFAGQIGGGVGTIADGFEAYGEVLTSAVRKMEDIRGTAAAAGLELGDDLILPPGPMPDLTGIAGGVTDTLRDAAAAALEEYRHKVKAFQDALAEVNLVRKSLYNGLRDLMAVEQGLEDILGRIKSIDWSKVKDNKVIDFLRHGSKVIKWADWALTAAEMSWSYCQGEPPGEILVRALGNEAGFWLDLAAKNDKVEDVLEELNVNKDNYEEYLGDRALERYRKLPEDVRDVIDQELERRFFNHVEPACVAIDKIEDLDRDSVGDKLKDAGENLRDFGVDRFEDAGENLNTLKDAGLDGLESAGEKLDDFGDALKPGFL
ncbi:MAG: hypothetical protein ACRDI1_05180 [Actinomycetota bacterium]